MDALALFLGLLAAVLVFDIAAVVWGADSRETLPDDHRRSAWATPDEDVPMD